MRTTLHRSADPRELKCPISFAETRKTASASLVCQWLARQAKVRETLLCACYEAVAAQIAELGKKQQDLSIANFVRYLYAQSLGLTHGPVGLVNGFVPDFVPSADEIVRMTHQLKRSVLQRARR